MPTVSLFIERREEVWMNLASACESGWDFSSRWLPDGSIDGDLSGIRTSLVIPVDLNAYIAWNRRLLALLHASYGSPEMTSKYSRQADDLEHCLEEVFWNPEEGCWQDLDRKAGTHINTYYASNLVPLYISPLFRQEKYVSPVLSYLKKLCLTDFPYGLPTSLKRSTQQWDMPNGWPPLNHMLIFGLQQCEQVEAKELALDIARKWVRTNYTAYCRTEKMYEKYDVGISGTLIGAGGEYEVQEGFGWTNGVIIDLLVFYGAQLASPESLNPPPLPAGIAEDAPEEIQAFDESIKEHIESESRSRKASECLQQSDISMFVNGLGSPPVMHRMFSEELSLNAECAMVPDTRRTNSECSLPSSQLSDERAISDILAGLAEDSESDE